MKRYLAVALTAVIALSPALADAKPGNNGNGNGNGNSASARGNGNGQGNGNGNRASSRPEAPGNSGSARGTGNGRGNGNGNRADATAAGAGAFANLGAVFDCPPGLAFRDPPCVPPGQADKGVTFQEWTGVSDEELDRLLEEAALAFEETETVDEEVQEDAVDELLLTEAEIVDLFDLEPAPAGMRYAVIDGQPVTLTEENYAMLQQIRRLASVPEIAEDLVVEPTVSLTEEELIAIYDLPERAEGRRYSVVDGSVVELSQEGYDLLQLLRLVSSV
ncbi:hypothetical protein [Histidinibacterium aquaticum]|uniref:Uncharacterized protein n=1 Tax=Histidinibacterium aquaticum TaxID=2613962 RepID=A0A5J5GL88_9RHOB|nr:hypothetical protein [Histidinibacterium aquaticum]KAA9008985.1 hypothetical protein F3S47_06935 [Histidinibacterium aquaticum]